MNESSLSEHLCCKLRREPPPFLPLSAVSSLFHVFLLCCLSDREVAKTAVDYRSRKHPARTPQRKPTYKRRNHTSETTHDVSAPLMSSQLYYREFIAYERYIYIKPGTICICIFAQETTRILNRMPACTRTQTIIHT